MDHFNVKRLPEVLISSEARVRVVATLDDIGGSRYFLRAQDGRYFYLDQDLEHCEEVPQSAVASAVLKHGYESSVDALEFAFKDRAEVLPRA